MKNVYIAGFVILLAAGVAFWFSPKDFEHTSRIVELAILCSGLFSLFFISQQAAAAVRQEASSNALATAANSQAAAANEHAVAANMQAVASNTQAEAMLRQAESAAQYAKAASESAATNLEHAKAAMRQADATMEQVREFAQWNKRLSYHQFFGSLVTPDLAQKVKELARKYEFSDNLVSFTGLDPKQVDAICSSTDEASSDYGHLQSYLDEFEEFACAVNAGIVDDEYAFTLEGSRVIRVYSVFEPLFRRRRAGSKFSNCYIEIERLGERWKDRREEQIREKRARDGAPKPVSNH